MTFRQKITLSLLFYIVSCLPLFAQVIHIPDPGLRSEIQRRLNLPDGQPLTREAIHQLTYLDADDLGITNLSGLEYAINLEGLELSGNALTDISPIAFLSQLRRLILVGNNIEDVTPLANLRRLRELNLRGNPLSNLRPLANLTKLEYLDLGWCRIEDVRPLANLINLKSLQLNDNRIVDPSPLKNLVELTELEIQTNYILDHSALDALQLDNFRYDQACELPPLSPHPRITERSHPSVFTPWSGPSWPSILNRPDLTGFEKTAKHDLWMSTPESQFALSFIETSTGFTLAGELESAIQTRDDFFSLNPNMLFIVDIRMRSVGYGAFPKDWPHWIKYPNGDIVDGWQGQFGLVDFTHPHIQERIVQQALAVDRCGLFDGIHFDWWHETGGVLGPGSSARQYEHPTDEAEQRARDNILERIRAHTRPDFLIMGNTNRRKIPRTGKHINGGFMETELPGRASGALVEIPLAEVESALPWLETNLRQPRTNSLVGLGIPTEPADSPANLRWMRAFTALSLTFSDGYILFQDISQPKHGHYWYDFWDADLGQPVGGKGQLYQDIDGLYIREFTNGWAVYNHSGETQVITLPEEVRGVTSSLLGTEHRLPNLDGEIYLKKTIPIDTPDVNGSDIFIAEPIYAVPGATLLLDASNNPETTAHWGNLGTAGGRLQASEILARRPRVEEGELEIPSIGFSGRRRYYTATASGQTFGGPVHTNPQLYLGNWTLEFLCKRNGNLFTQEHQFAGFQNSPREGLQGIRLRLDGQELSMPIHADGFKQSERPLNIFLEENVWTWVTIVSLNGESIIAYQDGVEVSRHPGVHFDASVPLNDISIGANSFDERHRNFNGSFAIVRVYDRALSPDEILQNIGATVIPSANPADVNGDGVVNILDLVVVAQAFGKDGLQADVNGDGVVNVFDLVQVAGAIGGGGAAPSEYSPELSIISAADVEKWLAGAQGLGIGDANFQRGIRFLQQLLAVLTPKETALLPNYPNPFNPETWIPYRLAREGKVTITIYDTKGTLVRRLALGNQAAGHYAERGKAAYWDGRNERGEAVASGIYIYQFRAGDYAASRRMVIVK